MARASGLPPSETCLEASPMESEIQQLTLSSSRRLGDRHRGRGQGQEEEIELRIKHQVHGGDIMPRLPWLPPAFPPERSLRQGLAKERKINQKKKETHSVHS